MSAEIERVFNDTKLFISDLRSRLGPDIIKALELQMDTSRAKMGVISVS